jgi:branched-chain amino acid aminotransferase
VTAGSGVIQDLTPGKDHIAWMTAAPAPDLPDATSALVSPWPRNELSAVKGLKCASYAENIIALQHAAGLGFEETVFLNTAGHVCEGATANVFLVKAGILVTPSLDSGCLPGITRAVVMELAHKLGIPCEERRVWAAELDAADEMFLTSSIRGVMAVSRFGGKTLIPGPVTGILNDVWHGEALGRMGV